MYDPYYYCSFWSHIIYLVFESMTLKMLISTTDKDFIDRTPFSDIINEKNIISMAAHLN